MGYPEFGDHRDRPPVFDADKADALKERLKEEGRWPPKPAPAPPKAP